MTNNVSSLCFIGLKSHSTGSHYNPIDAVATLDPEHDYQPQLLTIPAGIHGFAKIAKGLLHQLQATQLIALHPQFTVATLKRSYAQLGYQLNINCQPLPGFNQQYTLDGDQHIKQVEDMLAFYQQHFHSQQMLFAALKQSTYKLSQPPALTTDITTLPEKVGVYIFYDHQHQPIYIGKSVCIRQRVRSHFANRYQHPRSLKLFEQTVSISAHPTAGEFGALLLESQWVKKYKPLYNRKLRKTRNCYRIRLSQYGPYLQTQIDSCRVNNLINDPNQFGIFKSLRRAQTAIESMIRRHQLCAKLMGQQKVQQGCCFNYQLKQCLGACIGEEPAKTYNARVITALAEQRRSHWPYLGILVVHEHPNAHHLFLHWRYLGTVSHTDDISQLIKEGINTEEDLDAVKLLQAFLAKPDNRSKTSLFDFQSSKLVPLTSTDHTRPYRLNAYPHICHQNAV